VTTGERTHAMVDADRLERTVGVAVGHDGHRQMDPVPVVPKQVQHDFFYRTDGGGVRATDSVTASRLRSQSAISETKFRNPLAPQLARRGDRSGRAVRRRSVLARQIRRP
jgi:hypothetical protein